MNACTVTKIDIQALIDGELTDKRGEQVYACIQSNPQAKKYYDEIFDQKQLIQTWWLVSMQD
jgi:anti-sigma factor RsiW